MADTQRITITLPREVYNKIKEQAVRDVRTIGEEITYLLQLHVPSYAPQFELETFDNFKSQPQPENPTGRPTLTNDTTAYYKKTIIE